MRINLRKHILACLSHSRHNQVLSPSLLLLIPTKYTDTHKHTHNFFPFLAMRLLTVNRTLPENDNEVKTEKAMRESSFSLSRHVCKVPSSCPCVTLQTIAHQAPLSMGFSRQEYPQRIFPTQGSNPHLLCPPH